METKDAIVNDIVRMDSGTAIQRPSHSYGEIMQLAQAMAGSGYFKDARDAAQAAVKILVGQELGFGPAASMMGISIVEGKPSLGANLIAAAVKGHPKYDYRVSVHTDDECEIVFYERGEEIGRSRFDMKQAQAAGLSGRTNWKAYPRNMLFARAMSNGAKWYCAEVFGGVPVYYEGEIEPSSAPIPQPTYSGTVNQSTGEVERQQPTQERPKNPAPDGTAAFGYVPQNWPTNAMFTADPSDKQHGMIAGAFEKIGMTDDGDRRLGCELIARAYGVYDGEPIESTKQLSKGAASLVIDWLMAAQKDTSLVSALRTAMDVRRGQTQLMDDDPFNKD